ncbi:MAG: hypothetical protein K8823_1028 [Cenarchaeum symbiont of Oopsacas minuta]|nr:hypothetical protein [Cenarchaeum symbiont of Oopsacas minuta]
MNIGYVVGESTPSSVMTITSSTLAVGKYVIIGSGTDKLLGLVEHSKVSSSAMDDAKDYHSAQEATKVASMDLRDKGYASKIMLLGTLDTLQKEKPRLPDIPPEPGTAIYEAKSKDLEGIFGPNGEKWIRVGSLLRDAQTVVKIDVNKIISRHLGILAMTGMGKSNLVSLLAKRIGQLNGTVVIFDYHDDYASLGMQGVNSLEARINPRLLDPESLSEVLEIRDNATVQQRIVRMAFTAQVRKSGNFWVALDGQVDLISNTEEKNRREYMHSGRRVRDKIEDARRNYSDIFDPGIIDPVSLIREGRINVISVSSLTEKQANVAVSHYLQEILADRKKSTRSAYSGSKESSTVRFSLPIMVVLEEAHVFIPKGEDTRAKYWAARIAREGRKFGIGLAVISQRPRSIDPMILGQMGSLAVMRLVQQDDQGQVASSTESISEGLIKQLASLNVGDALLVGQWVRLPSAVHIDAVPEKIAGYDHDAVSQWNIAKEYEKTSSVSTQNLIRQDMMD